MNTHDETAEDSVTTSVNGFDEILVADEGTAVKVTVGSPERWDRSHLRRLRQSADLPGLVPVIDSDFASDGTPFAVTPVIDDPTLASMIPPGGSAWQDCAAITEAAARATHEAHLRGLFHGALSPDQIHVVGDDVAVAGIGLGLGGEARSDYHHWVAPEVLDGIDATERSDVYSLGKILEASLGDSLEDVPRSVRRLIMWSGSDTPEARPPSALEFASILAEALGDERKTYSPAFIPTAEANTLAATASGIVAAHTPSSSASGPAGLAAGSAVIGAATAAQVVGGSDDVIEVADGVEITPDGVDVDSTVDETPVLGSDDDILVDDSGVDVIDDDSDLDETVVDDTGIAPVVDDTDAVVEEPAPELDGVGTDAVITDEVEIDDETAAMAAAAAETNQLDDVDAGAAVTADDGGFDSREYSLGVTEAASEATDDYEVPAAQTVDLDPSYRDDGRGNRAGILVGAILAGGLALIAWGLLRSSDSTSDSASETTAAAPAEEGADETGSNDAESSEATTAEDPSSPVAGSDESGSEATDSNTSETAAPAESDEATATATDSEQEPSTSTTEAPTSTSTTGAPTSSTEAPAQDEPVQEAETTVPFANGPIAAADAGIQIVHGVPGADVDVYVDGEAIIPGFTAGTIAGPISLDAGSHVVDLYQAIDGAPAIAGDRTDQPITSQSVTVGSDPASLIAHLDSAGEVVLSTFAEDLAPTDPAQGRIVVRHLAQAPEVTVNIDGAPVPDGTIGNGEFATIPLAAGQHTVSAVTGDGAEVASATIAVEDGELASITVFGSADSGTLDAVVQAFSGLSSAPTEVPTGNSNLLGMDEDMTSLYLVGLMTLLMVVAGGAVMVRRRRIL